MKRFLALALSLVLAAALLAGCASSPSPSTDPSTTDPGTTDPAATVTDGDMYISVVSKGFQHQFWQAVKAGSEKAATDLGVTVFFVGPENESDVSGQIDLINAELAKKPNGLALAALDTQSVLAQLQQAKADGIPVIGFDSGVPNAPEGQIVATASTNNANAAAVGAEHMFDALKDKITAATAEAPVVFCVLSQDITSASITDRTRGFAEKMAELAGGVNDSVAITGEYAAINTGDANAAVRINVVVGASTSASDMSNAASGLLNTENLAGVFCSNEGAVSGLLAALTAGSTVPEGVKIVGFDSGKPQKDAVRDGTFMGSVTQDPFQIGYQAVEMTVKAARGESVSDVDTGAKWYDASNMDNEDIAILVYD